MKTLFYIFSIVLQTLFAFATIAQTPKGSLSDIGFIEGHWKAKLDDKTVEAVWSAPEGDNIVGFIRMMKGEKADLYEMFAFEQTPNGPVALVKHFKPGLIGLEEKEKSDRYNFVEAGKGRAVFEKEGDALRVLYEKRSQTQFVIALGRLQEGKWTFKDLFVFNKIK